MWAGLRRWSKRGFGIFLCLGAWMLAVGIFSLGEDWFAREIPVRSLEDLLLRGIVAVLGETLGAIVFFAIGIFILWAFWQD